MEGQEVKAMEGQEVKPMEGQEVTPVTKHWTVRVLDWMRISEARRAALGKFVGWFTEPSNLLSVAAIVAVVIVPWIEKLVRTGEDRAAKVDALLEATNKVIAMNQERFSSHGSDVLGNAVIAAQRENELAKASALAESIKHEVYPAVLFALSNELCVSGRFEEAHGYLRDVLKRGTGLHFLSPRPSNEELAQAHFVNANCYAEESQRGGDAGAKAKKLADGEMEAAAALLEKDSSDRVRGQLAINYAEWAAMDERMGDAGAAQQRREKARDIAKSMRNVDPTVMMIVEQTGGGFPGAGPAIAPTPAPSLKAADLPHMQGADTYLVTYPDSPQDSAALILSPPNAKGHYDGSSIVVLYLYPGGLFSEADEMFSLTSTGNAINRIDFQQSVPIPPDPNGKTRVQLLWNVESMDRDNISGIQSRVGRQPRHFVAHRSAEGEAARSN